MFLLAISFVTLIRDVKGVFRACVSSIRQVLKSWQSTTQKQYWVTSKNGMENVAFCNLQGCNMVWYIKLQCQCQCWFSVNQCDFNVYVSVHLSTHPSSAVTLIWFFYCAELGINFDHIMQKVRDLCNCAFAVILSKICCGGFLCLKWMTSFVL